MRISARGWLVLCTFAALAVALAVLGSPLLRAEDEAAAQRGRLTEQTLGNLLAAMELNPTKEEKRFDFTFKAVYEEQEWDLTMSAVLSENGEWIWLMAWLDELPRSANEVSKTALLRLMAENDRLGKGKFFAYIANNRRFVLQRVVANNNLTTAGFQAVLKDLGASVVETHPYWAVANWTEKPNENATTGKAASGSNATSSSKPNTDAQRQPVRSAIRDPKTGDSGIRK